MRVFGGIALVIVGLSSQAIAKPVAGRRVGVGVGFGEPTAVTGYLSLSDRFALDAALGMVSFEDHELAGHSDVLAIFGGGDVKTVAPVFYLGAGVFFLRFHENTFAGLRLPLGVGLHIPEARLQLFGEVSMELLMVQPYDTPRREEFQAAVGIRFFP